MSRSSVFPAKVGNPYQNREDGSKWYRGALHAHPSSLNSSDEEKAKDVAGYYRDFGHDFVGYQTFHRWPDGEREIGAFRDRQGSRHVLALPGIELMMYDSAADRDHNDKHPAHPHGGDRLHFSYISMHRADQLPPTEFGRLVLTTLDDIRAISREEGSLLIAQHPWSSNQGFDGAMLRHFADAGLHGFELFNRGVDGGSEEERLRANTRMWDQCLASGRYLLGFVDDCSLNEGGAGYCQTVVLSDGPELGPDELLHSIRVRHDCYAMMGVWVSSLEVAEGGVVVVETAHGGTEKRPLVRAEKVRLVGAELHGEAVELGEVSGHRAEFDVGELIDKGAKPVYVRIECVASDARRAFSQPILTRFWPDYDRG